MRLFRLTFLLLLAAILIVEPVVHTHPFAGNGSEGVASANVCAMCAMASNQITVARVSIVAPSTVADLFVAVAPLHQSLRASRPLASRAPPAA